LKGKQKKLKITVWEKNIWKFYWGINDSKKGYQSKANRVEDEECDLLVVSCGENLAYSN